MAHTPIARAALGPDKLLIPEQAVVVNTYPDEARRIAQGHMRGYLQLPNYVNNLKYLGYTDEDFRAVAATVSWMPSWPGVMRPTSPGGFESTWSAAPTTCCCSR